MCSFAARRSSSSDWNFSFPSTNSRIRLFPERTAWGSARLASRANSPYSRTVPDVGVARLAGAIIGEPAVGHVRARTRARRERSRRWLAGRAFVGDRTHLLWESV